MYSREQLLQIIELLYNLLQAREVTVPPPASIIIAPLVGPAWGAGDYIPQGNTGDPIPKSGSTTCFHNEPIKSSV
jgi:hypothetical protein